MNVNLVMIGPIYVMAIKKYNFNSLDFEGFLFLQKSSQSKQKQIIVIDIYSIFLYSNKHMKGVILLNLVILQNNKIITTSKIISSGVNVQHKNVIQLIENHFERIKNLNGVLPFETDKPKKGSKGGRPEKFYLLDEMQATFLISLMKNTEIVLDFKESLIREFFKLRNIVLEQKINQKNKEWLETREKGKQARKNVCKEYSNYLKWAIENNSPSYTKNPNLVYSKFTNMVYKSLFYFETKPPKGKTRDYLTESQLNILQSAELTAQKIIQDEIDKKTEYHEIYKITKNKMDKYAELVGKTKIIDMLTNNQISLLD